MGDIEDIKHAVQRDFLIPLSEFQAHTQALDTVHDQCVQEFQKALQALFSPGVAFHGAAADAVAQLTETYLAAQRAMGDYTSSSLSYRLGQAASLSQKTVAEIEPLLSSLHDFPLAQAFGVAGGAVKGAEQPVEESLPPPDPENPISLGIYLAGLAVVALGVGTAVFLTSYNEQQMRANEVWQEVRQWQRGMNTLAAQPESRLPPEPTDPKPFLASPGSILYLNPNLPPFNSMSHEQLLVQDIMEELKRLGITAHQSDVENLVKLGYDRARIISILSQSQQPLLNAGKAQIPSAKFEKYSMDANNPNNKGKWKAWGVLGYDVSTPSRRSAAAQDVMAQIERELPNQIATFDKINPHGVVYEIVIPITGPNGRSGMLVTYWQYDAGSDIPRLITNYLKV